ncbi:hypothetical protein AB1Y20_007130 [Prymnesium parvum]|uniref:Large ribosomal subunit protein uL15/eL18 domain-containing protein n=1 Tax=Prymnesium parvum TaxID=97485 RepID=A0AB34J2S0_PRYPA
MSALTALLFTAIGLVDGLMPLSSINRCAISTPPAIVTMKVYDWATRGDAPPALEDLDLSNMKAAPGSKKGKTRKGRGISAGQGATCGFGCRGQKSRSGRSTRPGFEGGQIPLYRRLPKYVGRPMGMSHSKTEYGIVKLNVLNAVAEGSTVDYSALMDQRLVSKSKYSLKKVVGGTEPLTVKGLTVKAHAFTSAAREAIEANSGTCVLLSPTTNRPMDEKSVADAVDNA